MEYLGLYLEFYKLRLRGVAQYRANFFLMAISKFVRLLAQFITLWIMVQAFGVMGTWSAGDVVVLFGLNTAAYAVAGTFCYHLTNYLAPMVRDGTFDEVLTKPLNPFWYLSTRFFSTGYVGTMLLGLVAIGYGFSQSGASPWRLLFLPVAIVSGGMIVASLMLITSAPAFWMVQNSALSMLFFGLPGQFADYPLSIFHGLIQVILTVALPFAFVTYYPAMVLLGKQDVGLFPSWLGWLSPLVAALLFWLAYRFWFYGLRRYEGAGN